MSPADDPSDDGADNPPDDTADDPPNDRTDDPSDDSSAESATDSQAEKHEITPQTEPPTLDVPEGRNPPEDGTPTVTCSRCNDRWDLSYELDDLQAGNRAVEQFAMDHHRHTGHYPDEVTPWVAQCRQCPQREQFLAERPARRFAETHARHTKHTVELREPSAEEHLPRGSPDRVE